MRRLSGLGVHAPFVFCLIAAFIAAQHWTGGLDWPCEEDFYRDMGFAQTILDGRYGEDPFYLGGTVWYNPLVHALVALLTFVTGAPLEVVYTRAGAYLNLGVPITFYLLAVRLFGNVAGLFAAVGFLFLGDHSHVSYVNNATYSPWLWPDNLAQGLFYATMIAFTSMSSAPVGTRVRKVWAAGTGALLGVAALAHAAPGTLGAIVIAAVLLFRATKAHLESRSGELRYHLAELVAIALTSMATSSPFLIYIVGHALEGIHNWDPMTWEPELLMWTHLPELLRAQLALKPIVALIGGVLLVRTRDRFEPTHPSARPIFFVWVGTTIAFITYNDLAHAAMDTWRETWPILVGNWHFVLYTKAAESLAFGVAASVAWGRVKLSRELSDRWVWVAAGVLALVHYPSYWNGQDLKGNHADASWWSSREVPTLIRWIRGNTHPDDVFLSSERQAVFTVGATGRKSVVLPTSFATPYVPHQPRAEAKLEMIARIETGEGVERLRELFAEYGVRFVILEPWSEKPRPFELTSVHPSLSSLLRPRFSMERSTGFLKGLGPDAPCSWERVGCQATAGRVEIYEVIP
ncbi:MAG: hypothetical protein HY791_24055 [Deltaproteobacteria bacterium]|nr:hypothetical protein [Deltaproteobacteria bacterium]